MKKRFVGFMMAIFIISMPAIVHADFADEIKLVASDGAFQDQFGWSVSISGDTAIVGAGAVNSAYIFVRDPATGAWTQQQELLDSNSGYSDRFGNAVSISGDIAIVGAEWDDTYRGSAYIFVRDPATGVWTQQQKLLAADGVAYDVFGKSVAISGDTAIVGANGSTAGSYITGYAYVFVRDPATGVWSQQQKLLAADGVGDDFFGGSVAIDGDTAFVGATGIDTFVGAVYAFVRDPATGVWAESQKLQTSNASSYDSIGGSISINGDTAIIGASGDGSPIGGSRGSAYIFVRDSATGIWTQQQQLWDPNGANSDQFGVSVAISGDNAIVGTSRADSAFAYVRDPGTGLWTGQKLLPSDGGRIFGRSVAIDGDRAIIGASGASGIVDYAGAAYVYTHSVVTTPDITVTDSVAPATDLTVAFGDVTEQAYSDQTVTITNDGNANLSLGNIAVANVLAAPFTIETDNCSGQVLTPAANCMLTVRFSPLSTGSFSDSFDIPSDDPDENSVTVSVYGTGVGLPVPDISVTDSIAPVDDLQMAFGNVSQGTFLEETVTIINDGTIDLNIGNIAALDVLVAPFSILNDTCSSTTVTPAASCSLTVRFEPTDVITSNDSFDIPSDDADEASLTFNLTGTGTVLLVPDISVTDSVVPVDDLQLAFGNVLQGTASDETVAITNNGAADLVIGNIAEENALGAPFSILHDLCTGTTVVPSASCTLTVRFEPGSTGTFNDSFDVPSNDTDEAVVTINVNGTSDIVIPATDDDNNGLFGIGAFKPLSLLAMLMLLVFNRTHRRLQ